MGDWAVTRGGVAVKKKVYEIRQNAAKWGELVRVPPLGFYFVIFSNDSTVKPQR